MTTDGVIQHADREMQQGIIAKYSDFRPIESYNIGNGAR